MTDIPRPEDIEQLKKLLEDMKSLSTNITVDPDSFTDMQTALDGMVQAQAQLAADSDITNQHAERANQLLERGTSILERQRGLDQKKLLDLQEQNKKRKEAERINSAILQTMQRLSAEIKQQNFEFDAQETALAKITGTTGEYQQSFLDVSIQARQIGATVADVSKNMGTLFTTFSGFSRLTKAERTNLSSFATSLDKVGFSAQNFAVMLDVGTKAAGMSVGEVKNAAAELVAFGQSAGISIEQLGKDVAGAGKQIFATFGPNGQKVFKDMALAAKNLGMSMDSLMNITERYTTFQGAAQAAGQLNSALGGNFVNTIDLMNASLNNPTDTFRLLKKSMDDSGKSFDQMTPAMKKFIAEASGIGDVSEAARIFSQDVDQAEESLKKAAKTQEELNKMAQYFVPIADKIKMLVISLSPVFETVTKIFGKLIDFLLWIINSPVVEPFKELIGVGIVIIPLFMKFSSILSVIGGAFASLGSLVLSPIAALGGLGAAIGGFGAAVAAGAWGLVAFGAAIALVGVGIKFAGEGFASIAGSFKDMGDNAGEAVAALSIFGLTMVGMAFSITLAVKALAAAALAKPLILGLAVAVAAIGAAFVLMGLGIQIASTELSAISSSMESIVANAASAKDGIDAFFDTITDARLTQLGNLVTKLNNLSGAFVGLDMPIQIATESVSPLAPVSTNVANVGEDLARQATEQSAIVSNNNSIQDKNREKEKTINIKIDSPINLNGKKVGKWVANIIEKDGKKATPGAIVTPFSPT